MRLVTRSDFDGLTCAVLLVEMGLVDRFYFVHPKDIQDGKVEVDKDDILANVPFVPGCGMWFDHHSSEQERLRLFETFHFEGSSQPELSCARVIYNYFNGKEHLHRFEESGLMDAVDRCDSARLSREEVLYPKDWILLSFIMDSRTGLGRFKDYRVSNYQLMENLIDYIRTMEVSHILNVPDIQERVNRYFEQEKDYEEMLKKNTHLFDNVLVINLLNVDPILSGNRFKEYVIFPDQNVSIRVIWGFKKQNIVLNCGYSIFKSEKPVDIGALMLTYGGGGHKTVGTCQVSVNSWEKVLAELLDIFKEK